MATGSQTRGDTGGIGWVLDELYLEEPPPSGFQFVQRQVWKRKYAFGSFLCCYAALQKSLPFYEGICFEKASMLLQMARFKDIKSYDISCFGMNPYGRKNERKKGTIFFYRTCKSIRDWRSTLQKRICVVDGQGGGIGSGRC